jgi:hypothetical protein
MNGQDARLDRIEKTLARLTAAQERLGTAQERQGKSLVDLITSVKESLEREMREGFDRIEKVTTRHTGLIASGTLAIGTLIKSSQKQDAAIKNLETRMRKLEGRKNGRKK